MYRKPMVFTVKQPDTPPTFKDLSKKEGKLLRYIVHHSGKKSLEDIKQKFGVNSEARFFSLFRNGLVTYEDKSEDDSVDIQCIRPTVSGEDFSDAVSANRLKYLLERIVVPLLVSVLGGVVACLLTIHFTIATVANNSAPTPVPQNTSQIVSLLTNAPTQTPSPNPVVSPSSQP